MIGPLSAKTAIRQTATCRRRYSFCTSWLYLIRLGRQHECPSSCRQVCADLSDDGQVAELNSPRAATPLHESVRALLPGPVEAASRPGSLVPPISLFWGNQT